MKVLNINCTFNILTVFKRFMIFCKPTQELGFHVTLSAERDPIRVCSLMLNVSANPSTLQGLIRMIIAAG